MQKQFETELKFWKLKYSLTSEAELKSIFDSDPKSIRNNAQK